MTPLAQALARRIAVAGPLTIADFMAEALGHPRHGYYATRDPLGAQGDFITAPEVSQIFGELIGVWCAAEWEALGRPAPIHLVELGPGRGTLMADLLRALRGAPALRGVLRLHLVETSPALRDKQKQTLAAANPIWHDTIATLPEGAVLLIANEFLDALPIRQFVRQATGWHERRVGLATDGHHLSLVLDSAPSITGAALVPPSLRDAAIGLCVEVRPAALSLAAALGERLARQGGAALFIDYGYWPSACGDTLQAVRHHRPHAILADPGAADLTAHVDFAAFGAAAEEAGAHAWGPVAQRDFLVRLGYAERHARLLANATAAQSGALEAARERLLDPAQMGSLFKVMALTGRAVPPPVGFDGDIVA